MERDLLAPGARSQGLLILELQIATASDVAEIVSLRNAANARLIEQFGDGFWAPKATEKGVLFTMRIAFVYVGRIEGRIVATLTLTTKKPWAIDPSYFHKSRRPLYLHTMAVRPDVQRQGVGRACLQDACRIASERQCDAIRLDAYDAPAGAGDFYCKSGFTEVGRTRYREVPVIYLEKLL